MKPDEVRKLVARLSDGGECILRFPNGAREVGRFTDVECVGDDGDLLMIRGNIEMRNFAFPTDAPEVAMGKPVYSMSNGGQLSGFIPTYKEPDEGR